MSFFFPQGTFFSLNLLNTSLNSFQSAESVVSDNISNANTPGASQQNVLLNEGPPIVGSPFSPANTGGGTFGEGVVIQQISRAHSNALDSLFRGASSSASFFQTEQQQLQSIQATIASPSSGIGTQFSNFQAAVAQLVSQTASGGGVSANTNVLTQAQGLTSALNNAGNAIGTAKAQLLSQGATLVTQVNGILDQIGALNGQIRASTAVGDSPNTFEDQRDHLIDQLSGLISTQTSVQPDGSTLVSVNGQALVNDTTVYHLAPPVVGTAANGTPTFKIDFATTPPTAANVPGVPLGSGQLAALQDLFNNKISVYGQQLDQFASTVASEVNRVVQSGFDQNGDPGSALFVPVVAGQPITAANITVGITDPTLLPVSLATTAAGSLVTALNSANNIVNSASPLTNNASLANPPAAALNGTLTVTLNGVAQAFAYNTGAGGNADSISDFVSSFNAAHLGVTASFNPSSQSIQFARDPSNEDLVLRGAQQGNPQTPTFTISDSLIVGAAPPANASLLGVLGASGINNIAQGANNAFGAQDNGVANALTTLFQQNVGVPSIETRGPVAAAAGVPLTIALPNGVNTISVGHVLTLDATPGGGLPQENVTVTSISQNPATGVESVTFTPQQNHAANFTVASAQVQTLNQFFGQTTTQIGFDTQTAITGSSTQQNLSTTIDNQRQSVQGINLNEEASQLIQFQNAFAAAARAVNVADSIVNTIVNSLGVGQ